MIGFKELVELVQKQPKKTVAVAACEDRDVLEAVIEASKLNIANFSLYGDLIKTKKILEDNTLSLPSSIQLFETTTSVEAAEMAVRSVKMGQADVLMKGLVDTNVVLKAVLNKDFGLRTNSLLSHVMMVELPKLKRIIFLTDAAMNINPSLEQLKAIIDNSILLAKKLNIKNPKVALISAVEKVNPKILSTLTFSSISEEFKDRTDAIIEGPLALDLAIDRNSAITKNIQGKIKGDADILVVPTIEVGNALYKGWVFGCENVKNAGVVVGASCPIILTSRADSHIAKVYSIALSLLM